jgi:CRP-like cAMP-binding protein
MAFQNHLLCELPDEIRSILGREVKRAPLRAGEVLQPQGQERPDCYFVEAGLVSVVRLLQDGTRAEAALIGREGLVGELTGVTTSFMEAEVQVGGEALCLPAERLHFLAARHEPLRDVLARYTQYLLDEARMNAVCNARHNLEQRLAKWLLSCVDRVDGATLDVTQEFCADMLGVQRTSVTGVLRKLSRQGIIQAGRGRIRVTREDRLKAVACECYEHLAERLPEVGFPEAAERSECPAA